MAGTIADILSVVTGEWDRWGNGIIDRVNGTRHLVHGDDELDFAKLVRATYCKQGVGDDVPVADIADDRYAWSAAFISWVMKQAGVPYKSSNNHSVYIRHYIKARNNEDPAEPYWGFKRSQRAPQVGDLVGYVRERGASFGNAETFFATTTRYQSHTDIVVATGAGRIEVIGGNVTDSVTKKILPVDASGRIADRTTPWFVVLGARFA